jgi:hypothetical protein
MTFTADPALKLQAIADALAVTFGAIDGLTVLSYDPTGAAISAPTLCVGGLEQGSTRPMERDHELGFRDWPQRWSLTLYVPYQAPEVNWPQARGLVGALIAAMDMDPHLGGEVREASITRAALDLGPADTPTRQIIGDLVVSVIHFQPNQ